MTDEPGGYAGRLDAGETSWLVGDVLALAVLGLLVGLVISWVRFRTAQLPPADAIADLGVLRVLLAGLLWIARMVVVFFVLGLVAYVAAGRKWNEHGSEWHSVVVRKGVARARAARGAPGAGTEDEQAPLGDRAMRILAGVNIGVLSAVVTTIVVTTVARILIDNPWITVPVAIAVFAGVYLLLTNWGPLRWGPRVHAGVWTVVALLGALFATLPLGLLLLIGVGVSTAGRLVARTELPRAPSKLLRSPLPWMMVAAFIAFGVAYYAVPPVPFQRNTLLTSGGQRTGGYVARANTGTYIATCQALADATAYDPRIMFVPASRVVRSSAGGDTFFIDSGDRPSLATLAMRRLGLSVRLPVPLGTGLRASEPTCGGTGPQTLSHGLEDPALGAGVIAGPAPAAGRAVDGDPPIEHTTPGIAVLARRLQPTVEVSAADLNWPVSLGALLADRGQRGNVPCLHRTAAPSLVCPVTPNALAQSRGDSGDYLQYPTPQARTESPSPLNGEPQVELKPFEIGQGAQGGSLHQWLIDPGSLNPWRTAQIYFVDAGVVPKGFPGWPVHDPRVRPGLLDLEYWFFYQYNYLPTLLDRHLLSAAPIGGDLVNTDLHQGDWEHVDVLVDSGSHAPEWIYLARHSNEGKFVRWGPGAIGFDGTHPIIQAAFGGHPSYTTCGEQRRNTPVPLSDWVACGYGRFAFRAATTPLVDLRVMPWACWLGHFGYAGTDTVSSNENLLDQASTKYYKVAGPPTPLRQAENSRLGLCAAGR